MYRIEHRLGYLLRFIHPTLPMPSRKKKRSDRRKASLPAGEESLKPQENRETDYDSAQVKRWVDLADSALVVPPKNDTGDD
jgi:hypothetical protein